MANKIATIARRFPGIADVLRRVLPLSLKRRIGAMMLERNPTGQTRATDGRLFRTIPDRVFLQVLYDGEFEPSLSNVIRKALEPGDTVVDIGANFGWFATLMAQTATRVVTYEPAFRMDNILRENVALNGMGATIDMRKKAVGAEPGTASFVIEGDPERESALGYVTVGADVLDIGSTNCYLRSDGSVFVAGVGLEDLIVVAHEGSVLVIPRDRVQDIKGVVAALKSNGQFDRL